MRSLALVTLGLIVVSVSSVPVFAEKRVALIMGNANYEHTGKLKNPVNDARLIAKTLRQLKFEVIEEAELTQKQMKRAISAFTSKLQEYGRDTVGLVFYAGHGVQVDGLNYLLPIDAKITREGDVAIEAVEANNLLFAMKQAGNRVNVMIFDACRDNPYRGLFRSGGNRGLAIMNAPEGSVVAYATSPGDVARDGDENNSPYTRALAKHIVTPGITIERILKLVARDVKENTKGSQRPWQSTDFTDDFYPAGGPENQQVAQVQILPKPETQPIQQKTVGVFEDKFRHGYKFQDCDVCPEMIVVRGGTFTMGSPEGEEGRYESEGPQREVTVKSFAVGRFEVTFDEWDVCAADGGCNGYRPADQGWGRDRRPVINVSWNDAQGYVKWLSEKTGQTYRLLTEAEWEYVARAGTRTPFWWGSEISTDQANYNGNYTYGNGQKGEYRGKTVPADSFEPNPWGLYNVHGNVREWVVDVWHGDYKGAPQDGSAWMSGGDQQFRVLRGGSCNYS